MSDTGCGGNPDQGIEDPDRLVLKAIAGTNYAGRKIYDVGPTCVDTACPAAPDSAKISVETYGRCNEATDAIDPEIASRGPNEWCKISPLLVNEGIDFHFNNRLSPTSVEFTRVNPTRPQFREVYDVHVGVVRIDGPMTRYNGDFIPGGTSSVSSSLRSVNLTCVENLSFPESGEAIPVDHTTLADESVCDSLHQMGGKLVPLRMQTRAREAGAAIGDREPFFRANDTVLEDRGQACSAGAGGVDSCCDVCDFELGVNVAQFGRTGVSPRDAAFEENAPEAVALRTKADAISCDPQSDPLESCRDFIPYVNRRLETRKFSYDWNADGLVEEHRVPWMDRIRETHPMYRGAREKYLHACSPSQAEACSSPGLEGTSCVGLDTAGGLCSDPANPACAFACRADMFVACSSTVVAGKGVCVDSRFDSKGATACYHAAGASPIDLSKRLAAERPAVPVADADGFVAVQNYDRGGASNIEDELCKCMPDGDPYWKLIAPGGKSMEQLCKPLRKYCVEDGQPVVDGRYAKRFLANEPGAGIRFDNAVKGVRLYPADLGGTRRAGPEACAQEKQIIPSMNIQDGWSPGFNASQFAYNETNEPFDRGMCSASTYKLVFGTKEDEEFIRDGVGNTLDGHAIYEFETPEFRVRPASGFPADNIRISGCEDYNISLSNKYDLSPRNLRKLQFWSLRPVERCLQDGEVPRQMRSDPTCWETEELVIGGLNCSDDPAEVTSGKAVPCLTIDVKNQHRGQIGIRIDKGRFGSRFLVAKDGIEGRSGRYRLVIPGLGFDPATGKNPGEGVTDPALLSFSGFTSALPANWKSLYQEAFLDVCGVPLITAGAEDFHYDFDVDPARCDEDPDGDGVPNTCDNAPDEANEEQADWDLDGVGDVEDQCIVTPRFGRQVDNDRDGVGDACDNCASKPDVYNKGGAGYLDEQMWIRSNPYQGDFDKDGIGDVCDNCPSVANCGNWGDGPGQRPADVTQLSQIDTKSSACQEGSQNEDFGRFVGAACEEQPNIGLLPENDFDGDGLANGIDECSRIPLRPEEKVSCTTDEDCVRARCVDTLAGEKICGHTDTDADGLGDICDTCPWVANAQQNVEGMAQDDDADGDFIGKVCELSAGCSVLSGDRRMAFYEVSVNGFCCATTFPGEGQLDANGLPVKGTLFDPDKRPVRLAENCSDAQEAAGTCRRLPVELEEMPGVVRLPPGCAEALETAQRCDPNDKECIASKGWLPNLQVNREQADGSGRMQDPVELWSHMCTLPTLDTDFDAVSNACDLCPFAFDPNNQVYIDELGNVFRNQGKFCTGVYSPETICKSEEQEDTTTTTATDTAETSEAM